MPKVASSSPSHSQTASFRSSSASPLFFIISPCCLRIFTVTLARSRTHTFLFRVTRDPRARTSSGRRTYGRSVGRKGRTQPCGSIFFRFAQTFASAAAAMAIAAALADGRPHLPACRYRHGPKNSIGGISYLICRSVGRSVGPNSKGACPAHSAFYAMLGRDLSFSRVARVRLTKLVGAGGA